MIFSKHAPFQNSKTKDQLWPISMDRYVRVVALGTPEENKTKGTFISRARIRVNEIYQLKLFVKLYMQQLSNGLAMAKKLLSSG